MPLSFKRGKLIEQVGRMFGANLHLFSMAQTAPYVRGSQTAI